VDRQGRTDSGAQRGDEVLGAIVEDSDELAQLQPHGRVPPEAVDQRLGTVGDGPAEDVPQQHRHQPPVALGQRLQLRRPGCAEQARVQAEPLGVVDVQQPRHRPAELALGGPGRRDRHAGPAAQLRPPAPGAVEVLGLQDRLAQERREVDVAEAPQLCFQRAGVELQRLADMAQDALGRNTVQDDVAAGRQEREPGLGMAHDGGAGRAGQRAQAQVPAEPTVLLADEVDRPCCRLGGGLPGAPSRRARRSRCVSSSARPAGDLRVPPGGDAKRASPRCRRHSRRRRRRSVESREPPAARSCAR
jgi:hypothetical protein